MVSWIFAFRIAQQPDQPAQGLGRFGIEQMQDRAGQQRLAGLDPMAIAVEAVAFGIDQNLDEVLDVAGLVGRAQAHLFERVVSDAGIVWIGRIELEAERALRLPRPGGQRP